MQAFEDIHNIETVVLVAVGVVKIEKGVVDSKSNPYTADRGMKTQNNGRRV